MTIAIDFDGTIVEHKFPRIGEALPGAIETIKMLKQQGHELILWTCRGNDSLAEAKNWLAKHDIEFDHFNRNPVNDTDDSFSVKPICDMYIDDRNFGGFPGWDIVAKYFKDLAGRGAHESYIV